MNNIMDYFFYNMKRLDKKQDGIIRAINKNRNLNRAVVFLCFVSILQEYRLYEAHINIDILDRKIKSLEETLSENNTNKEV